MALRGVKRKLFDHPSRDPNLDWSEYSEENFVDEIYLNTLHITAVVGKDAWNRDSKPQPVEISVRLQKDVSSAGEKDDIDQTVSYGKMCKDIQKLVASQKEFDGLEDLNDQIKGLSINNDWGGGALYVTSVAPKATLRAEGGISLQSFYAWDEGDVNTATWWINDMKMACIIGVNPHERLEKQLVIVNLGIWEDLFRDAATAIEHGGRNYWRGLTKDVVQVGL
ncbi:trifunctional dihydropteroate synthetase [Loxospora ochrophaea]|nr:trifunctional dihydropteroate synthetase [Loxospora ochrophaea]